MRNPPLSLHVAINVNVQGITAGFFPTLYCLADPMLLPSGKRGFVFAVKLSHLNVLSFLPLARGCSQKSRCVQIFLSTVSYNIVDIDWTDLTIPEAASAAPIEEATEYAVFCCKCYAFGCECKV